MGTIFQFPYRTVAEISLKALVKNLVILRTRSKREVIPVIKADAYGHGMLPIARALVSSGCVETLAVATLEEAIELRKKTPNSISILVLSGFLPHQIDAYLRYHLTPVIHSLPHLKSLLGRSKLPLIHLKVDTGMNRLGLLPNELTEAARVLVKLNIKLSGLMTHFADSEVTASDFVDQQILKFEEAFERLQQKRLLATDAIIHVSNTGALIRGKLSFSTAVRPGIGLFGILPNPRWQEDYGLTPVLEWRARILCLKNLKKGDTVGYSRSYKASQREKLAILPIGYADGYPRLLGNRGEVLVHGKKIPIRGIVSMDLTAVDCTSVPGVREGMAVTLIGQDGKQRISAWDIARWSDTIAYEVLCGISSRVTRVYFG